jgi:hypothetical protein
MKEVRKLQVVFTIKGPGFFTNFLKKPGNNSMVYCKKKPL